MKTQIIKISSYKEAEEKCPKGYRIAELWELVKLMQETDELLNYEKGEWRYFVAKQTKDDKNKKIVRRLDRDGDCLWGVLWDDDLDDFYEDCRVVYVKVGK